MRYRDTESYAIGLNHTFIVETIIYPQFWVCLCTQTNIFVHGEKKKEYYPEMVTAVGLQQILCFSQSQTISNMHQNTHTRI